MGMQKLDWRRRVWFENGPHVHSNGPQDMPNGSTDHDGAQSPSGVSRPRPRQPDPDPGCRGAKRFPKARRVAPTAKPPICRRHFDAGRWPRSECLRRREGERERGRTSLPRIPRSFLNKPIFQPRFASKQHSSSKQRSVITTSRSITQPCYTRSWFSALSNVRQKMGAPDTLAECARTWQIVLHKLRTQSNGKLLVH